MGDNGSTQFNIRISKERQEEFRKLCEERHLTQAQGFDLLWGALDTQEAINKVPERQADIETFQGLCSSIVDKYLSLIAECKNARITAEQLYVRQLEEKNERIAELNQKVAELKHIEEQHASDEKELEKLKKDIEDKDKKLATYKNFDDFVKDAQQRTADYNEIVRDRDETKVLLRETQISLAEAEIKAQTARDTAISQVTKEYKQELATLQAKLELANSGTGTKKTTTRTAKTTKKGEE